MTEHTAIEITLAASNEIARLRRVIEAQEKALAHWRCEADRDAGRLKRYFQALYDMAHSNYCTAAQLRERAQKEIENTLL